MCPYKTSQEIQISTGLSPIAEIDKQLYTKYGLDKKRNRFHRKTCEATGIRYGRNEA